MLACLGKFILVFSLCVQGGLLIYKNNVAQEFNTSLLNASKAVPQLQFLIDHQAHFDCIRYTVAGLYALSAFILVCECRLVPFLVSLGVVANTFLQSGPTLMANHQDQMGMVNVLKNLSIVAGLLYLMGQDSRKCDGKKEKQE